MQYSQHIKQIPGTTQWNSLVMASRSLVNNGLLWNIEPWWASMGPQITSNYSPVSLALSKELKACVKTKILSKFYFFTKWWSFKNCEKCFLFHLKSSFWSRDIQIFVFFPLPFHTFQIQKDKWKWNNLWCHELACINLQV